MYMLYGMTVLAVAVLALLSFQQAAAYEYLGENVLEVSRYKTLDGLPYLVTNASGVYVSGTGTMLLELDIAANSTLLFTGTVPSGSVSILSDPARTDLFEAWSDQTVPGADYVLTRWFSHTSTYYRYYDYSTTLRDGSAFEGFTTSCRATTRQAYTCTEYPPSTITRTLSSIPAMFRHHSQFTADFDHLLSDTDYAAYLLVDAAGPLHIRAENHTSTPRPPSVIYSTLASAVVLLEWECPIYDGLGYTNPCSHIRSFGVYRNGTSLANSALQQYTDKSIAEDVLYRYCVTATNTNAVTSECLNHDVRTGTLPAAPTTPHAAFDGAAVRVTWERPFSVFPISQFEVDRGGKSFLVAGSQLAFSDTITSDAPTVYAYKVRAKNTFGWSAWSPIVDVKLPAGRTLEVDADPVFDQYRFDITISSETHDAVLTGLTFRHGNSTSYVNHTQSIPAGSDHTQSHLITTTASTVDVTANFADGLNLTRNIRLPEPALNATHGALLVQYELSGGKLALNLKRADGTAFDETNCKYHDLDGHHTWYNETDVQVYTLRRDGIEAVTSYIDCFDGADHTIYSKTVRNLEFGLGSLRALNEIFGSLFGMPIVFFIVIFAASTFTARNAHIGVVLIGFVLAILIALGLIEISAELFGLVVALIVLGMLVGKKMHF